MILENHIRNILEGCRLNKRKSQGELHQLLYKYVFAICYRFHYNPDEVEKLANHSFICLFKQLNATSRNQYPVTFMALKAWAREIVITTCIHHFRHIEPASYNKEKNLAAIETSKDNIHFSDKQIIEIIRNLPAELRMIYNLFVIEKKPHYEIAQVLGISINCSELTLVRARNMLRQYLVAPQSDFSSLHADHSSLLAESTNSTRSKPLEKCFGQAEAFSGLTN